VLDEEGMLRQLRISALLVAAFAAVFGSVTWAPAQDGHTKPIELLIPYGPGGSQQVIRGRPLHIGHASEAADRAASARSGTGRDGLLRCRLRSYSLGNASLLGHLVLTPRRQLWEELGKAGV
jgi:hypothetical protein